MSGRFLTAATLALAVWPVSAAAQKPPHRPAESLAVQTEPTIEGARFILNGKTVTTDANGRVTVRGDGQAGLRDRVDIPDTLIRPGMRVQFSRRREGVFLFNRLYSVRLSFVDLQGRPIASSRVTRVTLKGSHGARVRLRPGRELWLQGARVVPFKEGYHEKRLEWVVEEVIVDGQNVVNRNQQRFTPASSRSFRIALLFYPAHFSASDALFGFATGTRVNIRYPSGRVEHHRLGSKGQVSLPSLPRGEYLVSVDGPGFSFQRPLALSKRQEVELQVLSYLDLAVGGGLLGSIAVGLLLLGGRRPAARRLLRRMRRRRHRAPSPAGAATAGGWWCELQLDLSGLDKALGACSVIDVLGARGTLVVCPKRAQATAWAAQLRRLLPGHDVSVVPRLASRRNAMQAGPADQQRHSTRPTVLVAWPQGAEGADELGGWDLILADREQHRLALSGPIVQDRAERLVPVLQQLLPDVYLDIAYSEPGAGLAPAELESLRGELGIFTVDRRSADASDAPARASRMSREAV